MPRFTEFGFVMLTYPGPRGVIHGYARPWCLELLQQHRREAHDEAGSRHVERHASRHEALEYLRRTIR